MGLSTGPFPSRIPHFLFWMSIISCNKYGRSWELGRLTRWRWGQQCTDMCCRLKWTGFILSHRIQKVSEACQRVSAVYRFHLVVSSVLIHKRSKQLRNQFGIIYKESSEGGSDRTGTDFPDCRVCWIPSSIASRLVCYASQILRCSSVTLDKLLEEY
jgi:hypothetical protein